MIDSVQRAQPGWVPFDHKIPLVGSDPDDLTDSWTVCFNSAWLPYVLGAVAALSRVEIWDTADLEARNLEAQRGEHLLTLMMEPCSGGDNLQLRACENGCGIEWSIDGIQWTCIDLSFCIADIIGQAVDTYIANGVLAQPGEVPTSGIEQPEPAQCVQFHVQMGADQAWMLPVQLSTGDTVAVSNQQGAWSDGKLGPLSAFWCPNGKDYTLGQCFTDRVPLASDPNQNAWHMEAMLQIGNDYYLPMREMITIPGGFETPLDAVFVPNYDRDPLGYGTVSFDVEVCRGGWVHNFDFTTEETWLNESPYNSVYVTDQGWESGTWDYGNDTYRITAIQTEFESRTLTSMTVTFEWTNGFNSLGENSNNMRVWIQEDSGAYYIFPNTHFEDGMHTITVTGWPRTNYKLGIVGTCGYRAGNHTDPGGELRITGVRLTGTGTDPFI